MSRPCTLVGLLLSASLAGLALVTLLAPTSCGSDAVGVDACRTIETARCNAATACGFADDKVQSCILFYRDQCLDGIENADAGAPATATIDACVAAVDATATCARAGAKTINGCAGAALIAGADTTLAPCVVLQEKIDLLAACSFATLAPVVDAGTTVVDAGTTDAAADAK